MSIQRLKFTNDLSASERCFLTAMQELGHGRFEAVLIHAGELVLDPWPMTVRTVKFSGATPNRPRWKPAEFELKDCVAELFRQVRAIDSGLIRVLEIRGGLPFYMDISQPPGNLFQTGDL